MPSFHSPVHGYRYDGLFEVQSVSRDKATLRRSCELQRLNGQVRSIPPFSLTPAQPPLPPPKEHALLPFRLPAPAPRKRARIVDPLGRTPDAITQNVWLTEIPSSERIIHQLIRGKCFLCHQMIYTTSDPDSYSLTELVAHLQLHKQTLESAMSPQLLTSIARYHQRTEKRVRCVVSVPPCLL